MKAALIVLGLALTAYGALLTIKTAVQVINVRAVVIVATTR